MAFMPYDPCLKKPARALRKSMTPQEKKLWYEFLRGRSPRFLRQKPLGGCIVDFYCPACGLAVEITGGRSRGEDEWAADGKQAEALEELGVTVLRFTSGEVEQEFSAVCRKISDAARILGAIRGAKEQTNATEGSL